MLVDRSAISDRMYQTSYKGEELPYESWVYQSLFLEKEGTDKWSSPIT